jgi:hypothetical protein
MKVRKPFSLSEKHSVSLYDMKRALGMVLKGSWLTICVVALVNALRYYQGKSDWRVEEGLASEMMILGFPSSLLISLALMLVGFICDRFGLHLPPPGRLEMITVWAIFVVAGYFQWFVIVPRLALKWINSLKNTANMNR